MHPLTYVFLSFGALLALIGIAVFIKKGHAGRSTIKMFGFEFQFDGSSLVIFVLGVVLFLVPVVFSETFLNHKTKIENVCTGAITNSIDCEIDGAN